MKYIRRPKTIVKTALSLHSESGPISFILSRSTGRRTLTICIHEDARVQVSSPFKMSEKEIFAFVCKKSRWIQEKVREAQANCAFLAQRDFDHGHEFLFLGKKHKVVVRKDGVHHSRIAFDLQEGWIIDVSAELSNAQCRHQVRTKICQWYRSQAKEILGGRIFHYARLMGVAPNKIAICAQKRLWGCCDYKSQSIRLNWQIVLSPLEVIDYVVVHELCHLTIPNHSKRFWKKIEKYMPDYKHRLHWLRANRLDLILPQ